MKKLYRIFRIIVNKYYSIIDEIRIQNIIELRENEVEADVNSLLNFLNHNNAHNISCYHDLSDLEMSFIKLILRSKDRKHQLEVEFRLELELSNNRQLRIMLRMYEIEEDYEKCIIIKAKLLNRK